MNTRATVKSTNSAPVEATAATVETSAHPRHAARRRRDLAG